jgi:hypothetical protein
LTLDLNKEDREYIWRVVDHAVEKAGSYANLFANRLEFFDETGRIRFHWPCWMEAIKGYLVAKYGENKANALLLNILREVMAEPNYNAYLRSQEPLKSRFKNIAS